LGPRFYGIPVSDNRKANTGLDRKMFFTGSERFQVKEIEVFQITD
jgi:hypothetical protein